MTAETPHRVPPFSVPSLAVAAVIVGLQGAAVVILAVLEFGALSSDRPSVAIGTGLLLTAAGAGLLLAAWGLATAHPRSRAPVIVVQVFIFLIASTLRSDGVVEELSRLAIPLALVAIMVLVLLFVRPSRRAFAER